MKQAPTILNPMNTHINPKSALGGRVSPDEIQGFQKERERRTSPSMRVVGTNRTEESVGRRYLAEATVCSCVIVREITSASG